MSFLNNLNISACSVSGSFYRFHTKAHFHPQAERFYKNFLDTPRSFERRDRFAPPDSHCGYYFGSSEFVTSAEALFYSGRYQESLPNAQPTDVFGAYKTSKERIFLTVDLHMDNIADLTNWENVRAFFDCGLLQWSHRVPELQSQYLECLISADSGGSAITDAIGWALHKKGYAGARFPSVRALLAAGDTPVSRGIRQRLRDIQNMSVAENIMDLGWQAVEQMRREFNLVVFSDIELITSIWEYSWQDHSRNGEIDLENPCFNMSKEEFERVRLDERSRLGFPAPGVANGREELSGVLSSGLLSDAERAGEFYCNKEYILNSR